MAPPSLSVDYDAVYKAWLAFKKGKKPRLSIDYFAYNMEEDLTCLATELTSRTYEHGGYDQVIVREKKRRDLAVSSVRDRVVHRLLYDHLLPIFDPVFDYDVWSCRKNKGLHKGLARTRYLLGKYNSSYIWRADITKFFDSVEHQLLIECLNRRIGYDETAMWLCQEVINSYSLKPGQGIPIGNLTSQLFANIYLHEFDCFVRHHLKPQAYVRYGDDFILFYPTRRQAYLGRQRAKDYLKSLSLLINSKNDVILTAGSDLKFLGHTVNKDLTVVDDYTTKSVLGRLDWHNTSSYKSLPLIRDEKNRINWILLEKYVDIL